jgi:hypothetical protein
LKYMYVGRTMRKLASWAVYDDTITRANNRKARPATRPAADSGAAYG